MNLLSIKVPDLESSFLVSTTRIILFFFVIGSTLKERYFKDDNASPLIDTTNYIKKPSIDESFQKVSSSSWAVIHVGPHKMSSSSIQRSIFRDASLLENDNYATPKEEDMPGEYTRIKVAANLALCLTSQFPCVDEFWPKAMSFLNRAAASDKGLLISTEVLDKAEIDVKKLKSLLSPWENVKIIVVYRRFYEWMVSLYFQTYRPIDTKPNYRSNVPQVFPSLVEWLNDENIKYYKNTMYTTAIVERYAEEFDNIAVINMHATAGIIPNFYCHYLPQARHTCKKAKAGRMSRSLNKGRSLDIDRLVNTAIVKGFIKNDVTIEHAITAVEQQHNRWLRQKKDFPRKCLEDDIMQYLLDVTLHAERKHFRGWFKTDKGEKDLRERFEIAANSTLCSVDVDAVLEDRDWRIFFRSMKPDSGETNVTKAQA